MSDESVVHGEFIIEVTVAGKVVGDDGVSRGVIRWWRRRGGKPGVMDELLYLCTNCKTLVNHDLLTSSVLCPSCGVGLQNSYADGQQFQDTTRSVAQKIASYVVGLKNNVDIKLVRSKGGSLRQAELDTSITPSERTKLMNMIRSQEEVVYYVKSRLEKDLLSGSDLVRRIEAFLHA
jgi:hypothetical protein